MILKDLKNGGSKALHSFENRTAKAQRVMECMPNTRELQWNQSSSSHCRKSGKLSAKSNCFRECLEKLQVVQSLKSGKTEKRLNCQVIQCFSCKDSAGENTRFKAIQECLRSLKKLTVNESRYKTSKSCLRSLKSFTGKNTRYESFRSLESFTSKECCRNLRSFKCFTSNDAWYKACKSCFRCLSKFAGDESERSLQTVVNDNNRCALNDRSSFNDGSNDSRYIRVIPADRKLLMGATVLCRCDILIARIFHVA